MKPGFEEKQDRREFFRTCARYSVLTALGAAGGVLLTRNLRDKQSQTCVNTGICDGCGEFSACKLPQALSAKQKTALNRLKKKE